MCDLWRHTTEGPVPRGAVAAQVRAALAEFPDARRAKLYNAGSFFDPRAFPREDLAGIALAVNGFDRVIIECHPALIGEPCHRFSEEVGGALELAMGLETIHPEALDALNKRMTIDDFRRAADRLASWEIPFRAFVLLGLPRVPRDQAVEWAIRSAVFAFQAGAGCVAIIPTRIGNGAMDALARRGEFIPPTLADLERAVAGAIPRTAGAGRVFADLWDLGRFSSCGACFEERRARIEFMNRTQTAPALPPNPCSCGRSA
jgi:radical SAM enzyme (TIGR01210 family)